MSYDDFETLTDHIQNEVSDNVYKQFNSLKSYNDTLGTIKVLKVSL
ncbi:hypothetical protein [Virgibacillus profundi]|nr:hypothetical protein [Virgibacillus profundi]